MHFLRIAYLVVLAEIKFRIILFRNRKLINTMKQLTRTDPKLSYTLLLDPDNPKKIKWETHWAE